MLRECDYSQALLEQVNQAISDKTPLVIQGSNSKKGHCCSFIYEQQRVLCASEND